MRYTKKILDLYTLQEITSKILLLQDNLEQQGPVLAAHDTGTIILDEESLIRLISWETFVTVGFPESQCLVRMNHKAVDEVF